MDGAFFFSFGSFVHSFHAVKIVDVLIIIGAWYQHNGR